MEISNETGLYIYPDKELDKAEGKIVEALRDNSRQVVPDRTERVDSMEGLRRLDAPVPGVVLAKLDDLVSWARSASIWTAMAFPACCAFEVITSASSRFDLSRYGMELFRASPRQADLMICAGTMTWKMAPQIKRIYEQMPEPKWVIAMGACAISGGIFASSYSVVPGYNRIIPVDVYVPGCPPRPEALLYGIRMLRQKIAPNSVPGAAKLGIRN